MEIWCWKKGIIPEFTAAASHESIGASECCNRIPIRRPEAANSINHQTGASWLTIEKDIRTKSIKQPASCLAIEKATLYLHTFNKPSDRSISIHYDRSSVAELNIAQEYRN